MSYVVNIACGMTRKKEGPKRCVTVVKHRVILLLVGLEAKRIRSMSKKQGVWAESCHSLRLVTVFLCDFSASVRGAVRGK